jgi:hypothetical protein
MQEIKRDAVNKRSRAWTNGWVQFQIVIDGEHEVGPFLLGCPVEETDSL